MSVLPRIVKLNKKDECSDEAAISLVLVLRSGYSVGKCSLAPLQVSNVWTSSLPAIPNDAHETKNIQVKELHNLLWSQTQTEEYFAILF